MIQGRRLSPTFVAHTDESNLQVQTWRLPCKAGTGSGPSVIGVARHGYIDFVQSKHARRAGCNSFGRYGGLESLTILLPISGVRKRRITAAKLAMGAEIDHPCALTDWCLKPDRIFALSDQMNSDPLDG